MRLKPSRSGCSYSVVTQGYLVRTRGCVSRYAWRSGQTKHSTHTHAIAFARTHARMHAPHRTTQVLSPHYACPHTHTHVPRTAIKGRNAPRSIPGAAVRIFHEQPHHAPCCSPSAINSIIIVIIRKHPRVRERQPRRVERDVGDRQPRRPRGRDGGASCAHVWCARWAKEHGAFRSSSNSRSSVSRSKTRGTRAATARAGCGDDGDDGGAGKCP